MRGKHRWYYNIYYANESDTSFISNDANDPDYDFDDSFNDSINLSNVAEVPVAEEFVPFEISNATDMVADILLELREKFNTTTKATNFIAEKMCILLDLDRKLCMSRL